MTDAHSRGILEGMEVVSADGQRIGSVAEVRVSERGLGPETGVVMVRSSLGPKRLTIPFSVVRTVADGKIVLDVTAGEAADQVWGAEQQG